MSKLQGEASFAKLPALHSEYVAVIAQY
jgi:hypothetical protein